MNRLVIALVVAFASTAAAEEWILGRTPAGQPIVVTRNSTGETTSISPRYFGAIQEGAEGRFYTMESVPPGPYPPKGDAYLGENAPAHAVWRLLQTEGFTEIYGAPVLRKAAQEAGLIGADAAARHRKRTQWPLPHGELGEAVAAHYARSFSSESYVEALAVMADYDEGRVSALLEPFLSGVKATGPAKNPGHLAGRLIFAEYADRTGDERALEILVRTLAPGFGSDGGPLDHFPLHQEMSDSVFMVCPLLAKAGKLTGEERYFELCVNHLRFMRSLCLREDGLYRHSPQNEGAWGRGNGFPALGLTWVLEDFPKEHPDRKFIEACLHEHLTALLEHQGADGMWRQLIDRPDSYREFTATCMITYALLRASRTGLVELDDPSVLESATSAVFARVSADGKDFVDACTGTGKQATIEDYYLRKAIFGPDQRSAAMFLTLNQEWLRQ